MLHVIAKSLLCRKFIFPSAAHFQKREMKYRNISRNCCCECSLTEIYDFPEFETDCECHIFRVICENLYIKGLFLVNLFSERNTRYILLILFDCSVFELL